MATRFPPQAPHPRQAARWTIGILVSSDCDHLSAALVATLGGGMQLRPELAETVTAPIPRESTALFGQLSCVGRPAGATGSAARVASLAAQLADIEAEAVARLSAKSGLADTDLLAVGVHDPGLWNCGKGAPGAYLGLCDAARLAELTGMNVIDAFPARDVVRGGQGGPITALPEWLFLRGAHRSRVLLHLGKTVRMTYLPRSGGGDLASCLRSFEVGPGTRMLDQLTRRLTGGQHDFDPGGRFAVQGRRIPQLQNHWLADPYFRRPLPRWQPRGVRPERFLIDAVQMAVKSGWSVCDLLCTATHLIAEAIALAFRQHLPRDTPIGEILLTGGGQYNGMLLREIAARLPDVPLVRLEHFGRSGEALGPACIALLAQLHLDQIPANHPAVTATDAPRLLGRVTPGSPQAWRRLLAELTPNRPAIRPLRAAS
jgi:anhydro-N-acetylmuramic acid kinase